MDRRYFIKSTALTASGAMLVPGCFRQNQSVPSYLSDYKDLYAEDPRKAAIEYFRNAKFGLFIHFGLYSLLRGIWERTHASPAEWIQYRARIRVKTYEKLADKFFADKFDPDFITEMALDAGMKYINLTTRHHDSFCLFDSRYTNFKSTNSAAKRDLVAELSEQCQKKGLGFFLYYSHGRDWRHPHAPNNDEWGGAARPEYDPPEETYKYGSEHDQEIYLEFMKNQITELLTNYGPIGAIWLDGIGTPNSRPEKIHLFRLQELYDHIHSLQPQVLVSYKQGLTRTEDFKAPERNFIGNSEVPLEICDTLQPNSWGYDINDTLHHKSAEQVMEMLKNASNLNANLLLNTGPLPNGRIHRDDVITLRKVGENLRKS